MVGPERWEPKPGKVGPRSLGPQRVGPRRVGRGAPKGGALKGGAPKGGAPKWWGPEGWGPKFRAFSSLSRHSFLFFFPSLLVFFVKFWWCLKRGCAQMCTFGVLGLSCASPGGPVWWARRGFTRQPENSKRAHLSAPALQTPPKFHEKDQKRGRKE